jgi:hypothetical protein
MVKREREREGERERERERERKNQKCTSDHLLLSLFVTTPL